MDLVTTIVIILGLCIGIGLWMERIMKTNKSKSPMLDATKEAIRKSETSEEVTESEALGNFAYVEFDQSVWASENTEERVSRIAESYSKKGFKLHSFNVLVIKGLIAAEKRRYCFMFERVTAASNKINIQEGREEDK